MSLLHVFLQQGGAGGGSMGMIVMMVAIVAIFYFFMIRPQQKKQKAIQKAREDMKVGDKVVTAGGIHGKIKEVGDTHFIVEIAENVRIKIEKSSVYAAAEVVAK
jgi:preprotein translocase subunit YajC